MSEFFKGLISLSGAKREPREPERVQSICEKTQNLEIYLVDGEMIKHQLVEEDVLFRGSILLRAGDRFRAKVKEIGNTGFHIGRVFIPGHRIASVVYAELTERQIE